MNRLVKFSGILSVGMLLAACQDTGAKDANGENASSDKNSQESAEPSAVAVEGIADHYHTGDEVELAAVPEEETELTSWQWYIKEDEASDWETVAGMTSTSSLEKQQSAGCKLKQSYWMKTMKQLQNQNQLK